MEEEEISMKSKRYTTEQIITNLRRIDVLVNQGKTVAEAVREVGITETTYYKWRKEYRGMSVTEAKKIKALEKENARLKRLVADLSLDNAILKDVAEGKF